MKKIGRLGVILVAQEGCAKFPLRALLRGAVMLHDDRSYYLRRAAEERRFQQMAASEAAASIHALMAETYEALAGHYPPPESVPDQTVVHIAPHKQSARG